MLIESLTQEGLGRTADGQFVPRTLPGEEIGLRDDGSAQILTPSADRVSAPCRHFKTCGGCAMQHAADPFVERWKAGIVTRALAAHSIDVEIRAVHTSPPQSRRRAKFAGKRTKNGALVGFHTRASDAVIAVPDCQLLLPGLRAAIPALEELTVLCASRKAEIALTVTDSRAGLDVWVESDKPLDGPLRITLAEFAQRHGFARLAWGDEPVVTINAPTQQFGRADVTPPAGAFLQATREGEAQLRTAALEATKGADRVVDLFSGCGTFALPLAETAVVTAVESSAPMLAALDQGWRKAQGLKQVTTQARDLFRRPLEPDELRHFDAAVIDPPRAGAQAQIATLAQSGIKRIAMISCNPVTFARDAKTLVDAGFAIVWVDVVDQFRWSPHVEIAASFTRS
ncbi:class I SAM-dependent RNA methyltransferase [Octadecabacter sp. R77987]|uniref:class I SAM-dependent RNA methyltransferase n=1 Tax=Octadecabacter sp. R77987 TaxID=3093874 RepID=UPI00366BA204